MQYYFQCAMCKGECPDEQYSYGFDDMGNKICSSCENEPEHWFCEGCCEYVPNTDTGPHEIGDTYVCQNCLTDFHEGIEYLQSQS